jgi:FAD/FMN-containing dehydrogenase
MIKINPEDQYAICSGSTTLIELEAALPLGLQYRAPRLPITLEDWLLSGGIGILTMPPVRKDILGLTYTAAHGTISIGGKVVKNVAGYDAVRLLIGSDTNLTRRVRIQSALPFASALAYPWLGSSNKPNQMLNQISCNCWH